ncbi:MAG: hypothetical protein WCG00_11755 [Hyphomicrobiales bacterium]
MTDSVATPCCGFCKGKGEPESVYSDHHTKNSEGKVVCPQLFTVVCGNCKATGEDAHTTKRCPTLKCNICGADGVKAHLDQYCPERKKGKGHVKGKDVATASVKRSDEPSGERWRNVLEHKLSDAQYRARTAYTKFGGDSDEFLTAKAASDEIKSRLEVPSKTHVHGKPFHMKDKVQHGKDKVQHGKDKVQHGKDDKAARPPPEGFICKACNIPGHWIIHCPVVIAQRAAKATKVHPPPPDGYTCKACNEQGHWIQQCTKDSDAPLPDGYVCKACNEPGHWIKKCAIVIAAREKAVGDDCLEIGGIVIADQEKAVGDAPDVDYVDDVTD